MLSHPQLPPGLIERCLDVLKKIMPSERDLIRVIVEIIVELRAGEDDAENADEPVGSYCFPNLPPKIDRFFYFLVL
jgi:condensin complex subunit 3